MIVYLSILSERKIGKRCVCVCVSLALFVMFLFFSLDSHFFYGVAICLCGPWIFIVTIIWEIVKEINEIYERDCFTMRSEPPDVDVTRFNLVLI